MRLLVRVHQSKERSKVKHMYRIKQIGLVFIIWAVCLPMHTAMALKVACVGDSHTYHGIR